MAVKNHVHSDEITEQFYTLQETAELLKVSYATVRNWMYDGTLKAKRVGGIKSRVIRVPASAIKAICADEVIS